MNMKTKKQFILSVIGSGLIFFTTLYAGRSIYPSFSKEQRDKVTTIYSILESLKSGTLKNTNSFFDAFEEFLKSDKILHRMDEKHYALSSRTSLDDLYTLHEHIISSFRVLPHTSQDRNYFNDSMRLTYKLLKRVAHDTCFFITEEMDTFITNVLVTVLKAFSDAFDEAYFELTLEKRTYFFQILQVIDEYSFCVEDRVEHFNEIKVQLCVALRAHEHTRIKFDEIFSLLNKPIIP